MNSTHYYRNQSSMTDPREYRSLLLPFPDSIPESIHHIQGLFLHNAWALEYKVEMTKDQRGHVEARSVEEMLRILLELDDSSLLLSRPYEKRFFGNCRDHALFLTSILRLKGIPARCRCGFALYFVEDSYEDHWICEYWDEREKRWIGVDPQLDPFQQERLHLKFDPLNLPEDAFLRGSSAWRSFREGRVLAHHFGIHDLRGPWFIRNNLIKDLAALNKMEMLPWDSWGLMEREESQLSQEEYELLDEVAYVVEEDKDQVFSIYKREGLEVPETIKSYRASGVEEVQVSF